MVSINLLLREKINLNSGHLLVLKPTRITEHSSTLLDPIIISDSVHYSYSDVLKVPSDISDAVFRNSRGLFNNIRQIKQIHVVNQFIITRRK
jgi:hypothetical protein